MPLYPGASRGCNECRKKKKKCDLDSPVCRRCAVAGIQCSGPKASRTFVHRNESNMKHQSDRAVLLNALHDQKKGHGRSLTPESAPNVALARTPGRMALLALVQDFQPLAPARIFSGDRISRKDPIYSSIALCIRALLPVTALNWKVMDMSMFSLLSAYMGGLRGDAKLAALAQSSYVSALGESHTHIQQVIKKYTRDPASTAPLHVLLLITVAFQAFELLNNEKGLNSALEAHVGGALEVLKMSGPETYETEHLRQAFSGFRGILLSVALEKRQSTFLAEPQWIHDPFQNFKKTRRELLHDIAMHIPALLQRTDELALETTDETSREANLPTTETLLMDYQISIFELRQWLDDWSVAEKGPLYWRSTYEPSDAVKEVDPECIPVFEKGADHLCFQTTQSAGLLITYWSFVLELAMGMMVTQLNLPETMRYSSADALRDADETMQLIVETSPHLSSCFEGVVTVKGPLQVVARYLQFRGQESPSNLSLV